jgi:restriction endonuclease S subunit
MIRAEVVPGDLLITIVGSIGNCCVVKGIERANINQNVVKIRPTKEVDSNYLSTFINSRYGKFQIQRLTQWAVQANVNFSQVGDIKVLVPSLETQRSLVAEIEAARQTRTQKLAQADELLSSLDSYLLDQLGLTPPEESDKRVFAVKLNQVKRNRLDVFNIQETARNKANVADGRYPNVPLIQVAEIIMGQAPRSEDYNEEEIGLPLIAGAADLGEVFPLPKKWTKSAPKRCQPEDIILCIRATIGTLNWADRIYCLGRGVAGVRPKSSSILASYLYEALLMRRFYLTGRGTGSTFKQVVAAEIEACPIPLPPLDIQARIASEINKRRDEARQLAQEAETEWEAAKICFERKLLGEEA